MSFNHLGLLPGLTQTISDLGYDTPTPIQQQAIPAVLEGRDVMGGAQTGTGKTAAFALPTLQILEQQNRRERCPRALVLTPTRELAAQVYKSFCDYGARLHQRSAIVFGGVNIKPQIETLRRGTDILVACPGRLLDHANQRTVDLSKVEILILDEADRMLDMGFIHDIRRVLRLLPPKRQNLLFSATYSNEIRTLCKNVLYQPVLVEVARKNTAAEQISQVVYPVSRSRKRHLLSHLIHKEHWPQALVFTRTKHGANRLAAQLTKNGINAAAIHGNKSQNSRTETLAQFKRHHLRVLVATDIAARGLDIDQLSHVVNFDLPNVPEDYVHRIGRTGRAGASGIAVSLVDETDLKQLNQIERLLRKRIPQRQPDAFDIEDETTSNTAPSSIPVQQQRPVRAQRPQTQRGAQPSTPRTDDAKPKPRRRRRRSAGTMGGNESTRNASARNSQARGDQTRGGQARSGQTRPSLKERNGL